MFELLNETLFEKHMAEYLAGSKMYNQRTPKDFNHNVERILFVSKTLINKFLPYRLLA